MDQFLIWGKAIGAIIPLNWFTRKKVVKIIAVRHPIALNKPARTPYSEQSFYPVYIIPLYFFLSISPCMQALIASIGCVITVATSAQMSDPIVRAFLLSMPLFSFKYLCISGVTPNIAHVYSDCLHIVMGLPLKRIAIPYSFANLAGVARRAPPNRCYWIIVNSSKLHGSPEQIPPRKADRRTLFRGRALPEPSLKKFWKAPTNPNWRDVVAPRFIIAIGIPLYTTFGLKLIGNPYCAVFFQLRSG